jgi:methionyl-tRNA formyltransferase
MSKPQVVFFGTGPVAAKSLQLLSEWADIEAVITKPKPAHHKGSFPVLDVAEQLKLPVHTVTDKKSLDELMATKPVTSELGILIDFGIIVSQAAIDYFPLGIVNSHFSLLPQWRGADPITFAILSGQEQTGVSLMLLVQQMDEGPLLAVGMQTVESMTTAELTDRLIYLSNSLLQDQIPRYISGEAKPVSQSDIANQLPDYPLEPTYSRKLTKEDSVLDFTKPAAQLERETRAFIDWPKSRTTVGDRDIVITTAHILEGIGKAGEIWQEPKQFGFYTSDGILVVDKLKPAGKAEMTAEAFLAGYQI